MVARRQQAGRPRRHVDAVEVLPAVREVADAVLLEVVAVDHDRRRLLRLRRALRPLGIGGDHRQPLAVRRPGVVRDPARERRQRLGLAAAGGHHPDLGDRVVATAVRQECQPGPIRAPPRHPLVVLRRRRQGAPAAAVPVHAPQVGLRPVLLEVRAGDRVGDLPPVRGQCGLRHRSQPVEVGHVEQVRREVRPGRARNEPQDGKQAEVHAARPPSASARLARSSSTASSTSAMLTDSGGMKRTVLLPQDSSSRPLW